MKYIELISLGFKGTLNHSILQENNTILSFENGEFKIYDNSFLKDRVIVKEMKVPKVNLRRYEGLKMEGFLCYEAIEWIYKSENKKMTTYRNLYYFGIILLIFISFLLGLWIGSSHPEHIQAYLNNLFNYK